MNDCGQLALNHKSDPFKKCNELSKNNNYINIYCGWRHCCGIGIDGNIYSWGNNEYGQLGNEINILIPTKLNKQLFDNQNIKLITCGGWGLGLTICLTGN